MEEDYWLQKYSVYMTPEFRQAYRETKPDDRLFRFGDQLIDYARRKTILDEAKVGLDSAQLEEFRRLPDWKACLDFVRALEADAGRVSGDSPKVVGEPR